MRVWRQRLAAVVLPSCFFNWGRARHIRDRKRAPVAARRTIGRRVHAVHGFSSISLPGAARRITSTRCLIFLRDGFPLRDSRGENTPVLPACVSERLSVLLPDQVVSCLLMLPIVGRDAAADRFARATSRRAGHRRVCGCRNCSCPGRFTRCARFPWIGIRARGGAATHYRGDGKPGRARPWLYLCEMPRFFGELVWIPVGAAVLLVMRAAARRRTARYCCGWRFRTRCFRCVRPRCRRT